MNPNSTWGSLWGQRAGKSPSKGVSELRQAEVGFSSDLKEIRGDHNLGLESQSLKDKQSGLFCITFTAYHCIFMCV